MDESKPFFGTQPPFAGAEQEALYETLGGFLQGLLVRQFDVSQEDAELLVCQAFYVYYQTKVPVANEREWLISSACGIANKWLQTRGLPSANEAETAPNAGKRLSHREAVAMLPEPAQEAVRLRFEEKKDYPEIAAKLGVSTFAAQHIVKKAVVELRGLLRGEGRSGVGAPQPPA